jgi:hypothetical protein
MSLLMGVTEATWVTFDISLGLDYSSGNYLGKTQKNVTSLGIKMVVEQKKSRMFRFLAPNCLTCVLLPHYSR